MCKLFNHKITILKLFPPERLLDFVQLWIVLLGTPRAEGDDFIYAALSFS